MIARLMNLLHSWRADAEAPTRVGVLNTGELIVLSPEIGTLVLGKETTDLVRDALWLDDGRKEAPHERT